MFSATGDGAILTVTITMCTAIRRRSCAGVVLGFGRACDRHLLTYLVPDTPLFLPLFKMFACSSNGPGSRCSAHRRAVGVSPDAERCSPRIMTVTPHPEGLDEAAIIDGVGRRP